MKGIATALWVLNGALAVLLGQKLARKRKAEHSRPEAP